MFKAIYWNCRGALKKDVLDRCRDMSREHCLDFVFLLEMHADWAKAKGVSRAMGRKWSSFTIPAEGISGGLILLWKTAIGYVDVVAVSRYAAHMVVSSSEGETWLMTAVYASNQLDQQKLLWEELVGLGSLGLPWLVGGDFNAILSMEEKRSYVRVTLGPKSSNFAKFVEEAGVCDLGYEGVPFTWCNN
ncbi:uncharacterized protein [Typha latifolia]|uniref:uncharacterized protein n=1 Tax=Typha latifolia TaxID=4733 RepID=UPI003C305CB3